MRVFCAACKEVEGTNETPEFDPQECKKCNQPCAVPSVFECAQYGLLEELKLLVDKERAAGTFDVNGKDNQGATLLHWASLNNRLLIMMYLLDQPGIQVNIVGGELQSTPIYWASHRNNIYAVALLLEHHADSSITDKNGTDAYFVAAQSGFTILSSYMIAMGSNVDRRNGSELTPLMWLCRYNFELDTMRMLFGLGANVNLTDAEGNTALHLAATSDFARAAKLLIDHGVDIYAKNKKGETALDISTQVAKDIETRTGGKRTAASLKFLRKIYAYDSSYNSFPLSVLKKHNQQTAFWTPWIVLGLLGYSFHALSWPIVLIGVFLSLGVGYFLFQVAGLGVNPGKRKNGGLMLGVNIGSTFWIAFVFFGIMATEKGRYNPWVVALLAFLCTGIEVCLYITTTRDPGYILTTYDERLRNIRNLVDMKSRSDVKLCTTCIQRRPLRSKHDAELNVCVARFDHYCPFVANAVGANNHTYFLGFLFFAVAGIGLFIYLAFEYLLMEGVFDEPTYVEMLLRSLRDLPVVTWTTFLAILHICWIGYLLFANIYGILFAWTTNECVLHGRTPVDPSKPVAHHSKFSRGVVQNVIDFFHLPLGNNSINWTKARFYNVADIHSSALNNKNE